MKTLTLLETLSDLRLVKVAEVGGVEFDIPYFKNHYSFKDTFYTFRLTDKQVREDKLINAERVRLCSNEGCVAVYELTVEPLIYLIEIWKDRGKKTYLETVKLRYYSFGNEKPNEKPLGYIKVGSRSAIGLVAERQACELIEGLVKKDWRVHL